MQALTRKRTTRRALLVGAGLAAVGGGGLIALRAAARSAYAAAEETVWTPPALRPEHPDALRTTLVHYATLAANGHNTQPWRFRLEAEGIRIGPDPARRTPVVDPDDHHVFASLGAAAENLAIAAGRFGLAAEVAPGADGVFVALSEAGTAPGSSPLFAAVTERRCVRLDYDGAQLSAADWNAISAAGTLPGVDVAIHTSTADRDALAALVVAGNTAQMGDPAFVAELKHWIRFDGSHAARTLDGLYAAASGNPEVPAWLGARLFDYAFTVESENARYRRQMETSAGVAVVLAETDAPAGWIQAGRAAQRMALEATARGIRSAFLNQPTEALGVRPDLMAFLKTSRRPNLVMRFGRGPLPPRSLRRPPEAVIDA